MLTFRATRLAPSPTGALHLGHARTFLITWWLARQAGAKIYMRMDDLDAGRAKPESVQQAYDDLRWLGIDWDAYEETPNAKLKTQNQLRGAPSVPEPQSEVIQSHRLELYNAALEQLWHARVIYPCICTRADIAAQVAGSASAPHEGDSNPRYPGTCHERFDTSRPLAHTLAAVHAATGKPACLRLRVPDQTVTYTDLIAGPQSLNVAQDAGDFPITRFADAATGQPPPAYQLACVVDDAAMAIDLVIRGSDLLASTPRQILLYQSLGLAPPRFAHVPLVIGPDGKRLAKRHGESRIAQFRAAGVPPEKIVGWAAWRGGQLDTPREISAQELIARFDPQRLPPQNIILTPADLSYLSP